MHQIDIERTGSRHVALEGNAVYETGTADFRARIDLFGQRIFVERVGGKNRVDSCPVADGDIRNLFPVRIVGRAVRRQGICRNLVAVFRRIKPAEEFPAGPRGNFRCVRQHLKRTVRRHIGRATTREVLVERHRYLNQLGGFEPDLVLYIQHRAFIATGACRIVIGVIGNNSDCHSGGIERIEILTISITSRIVVHDNREIVRAVVNEGRIERDFRPVARSECHIAAENLV